MDIRNSLDGLKSLLGVNPTAPSAPQSKNAAATATAGSALRQRSCDVEQCGKRGFAGGFGRRRAYGESGGDPGGAGCGNLQRARVGCGLEDGGRHAGRCAVTSALASWRRIDGRRGAEGMDSGSGKRTSGCGRKLHGGLERQAGPELKALIAEASRALARLDTGRLEELALSLPGAEPDAGAGKRGGAEAPGASRRGRRRPIWRCLPACWMRRGPI